MEKTIFEQMGGTYAQAGDYNLPSLILSNEESKPIGIWGQRHYAYLKKHSPTVINVMRMKGTLQQYLKDIDKDAKDMFYKLVKQLADSAGINEALKSANEIDWIRSMNSIRNRAEEIVLSEVIYN